MPALLELLHAEYVTAKYERNVAEVMAEVAVDSSEFSDEEVRVYMDVYRAASKRYRAAKEAYREAADEASRK